MHKINRSLYHKIPTHKNWLNTIKNSSYLNETPDIYNEGVLIDKLENKVAHLLGKEKALFFHKGVCAQLSVLKVVSEKNNNNNVLLHPKSHIAGDEEDAYQKLLGLTGIEIGQDSGPFNFDDIQKANANVGSLVVELPLRRTGFKLTPWEELIKMHEWCIQQNTHFHMDGARLWESTTYYQKSLSEISALFDSVYVSFYKGLGGISGAILAGNEQFISKCKVWRTRLGGDIHTVFPVLISALEGLDLHLEKIPMWVARAQKISTIINSIDNMQADKPHTNGFLIYVKGDRELLNKKVKTISENFGIYLIGKFMKTDNHNVQKAELQVGPGAQEISDLEIKDFFTALT